jgi:acetyl esterase
MQVSKAKPVSGGTLTSNAPDPIADLGDDALDPELRPIVLAQRAQMAARGSLETVTPAQMRARAAAQFAEWNRDPEPLAAVRDFRVGAIPVRLYDPAPGAEGGLLVYLHGGGWVIGDLDLEDAALRRIAARSGVRILSVDYRLAPEHPFPAPLDDAEAVVRWAAAGPPELSVDAARIGLGGASAGANIALGTALRLRDGGGPALRFLLLMYGPYAGGAATSSYLAFADGRFGLPRTAMDWFWRVYTGAEPGKGHPCAVPLAAELAGLPPVFLNHAELDILRDDTILLAERLRTCGVAVEHRAYAGAVHGFTQYAKGSALARGALDDAAAALAAALG